MPNYGATFLNTILGVEFLGYIEAQRNVHAKLQVDWLYSFGDLKNSVPFRTRYNIYRMVNDIFIIRLDICDRLASDSIKLKTGANLNTRCCGSRLKITKSQLN